ncbi:MAG: RNA polymerase sigma factor [Cellulosilyticaceae bacterium]
MFDNHKKRLDKLFIDLCEQYHKSVVKYLYYTIGDIEAANDLAQEVFMVVYRRIEEVENHENSVGFIFQTAKFAAANYKRKVMRKNRVEQPLNEEIEGGSSRDTYSEWEMIEDGKIDESQYVDVVMAGISKEKQLLYRMYYIEGKTYREIAQVLGVSEVSLRMKFVRLRREIKSIASQVAKENFA